MRRPLDSIAGVLVAALLLGAPSHALAQLAVGPFAVWENDAPPDREPGTRRITGATLPDSERSAGNHAGTGLLVGVGVGIAAATVFLIQFCNDPDTECGADEVGKGVAVFTVPAALAGALIGALIPRGE